MFIKAVKIIINKENENYKHCTLNFFFSYTVYDYLKIYEFSQPNLILTSHAEWKSELRLKLYFYTFFSFTFDRMCLCVLLV